MFRRAHFFLPMLLVGCASFGHNPVGARLARVRQSPEWSDGHFLNPQPMLIHCAGSIGAMFHASTDARPKTPVQTEPVDPKRFDTAPTSGLRITWFGHSTLLIEIDGRRIRVEPIFSPRASPFSWVGSKRFYPPLIALSDPPKLDAVVISHDHFDHLDYRSILALAKTDTTFFVPLGVGAHLAGWGIAEAKIVELDWWEQGRIGDVELTCENRARPRGAEVRRSARGDAAAVRWPRRTGRWC